MDATQNERQPNGRYAPGNRGGPGRPRRRIEVEYLAALSEAVPLSKWRAIVRKAREQAEQGDAQARRWLSGYLLGTNGPLLELAARETLGRTADDEIVELAEDIEGG